MKSIGNYPVYLTGSKKTVNRAVKTPDNEKFYIVWYGQLIEVVRGYAGYFKTVEAY